MRLNGWIRAAAIAFGGVGVAVLFVLWRLCDLDLDHRAGEDFEFEHAGAMLSGSLWLPDDPPRAAVALVHGDGPQDRTSGGGYAPLVNTLLDAGIAVAAWDKPGRGGSGGCWLDQSMADRAAEARAGLARLRARLPGNATGALGFSQAGWVLPRLRKGEADFLVLVGPAVSWQRQGDYYARVRLRRAGETPAEIERRLAADAIEDARIFGVDAAFDAAAVPDGMSRARWSFIRQNRGEDSQADLAALDIPLLAIWGAEDLNVEAASDAETYRATVRDRHPANEVVVIADATHGLLKAGPYNAQLVSEWPWSTTLRFLAEGRHAFAPGALDIIRDWILERAGKAAE